jgi:ABC-type sugar transport system substrate-binding protein
MTSKRQTWLSSGAVALAAVVASSASALAAPQWCTDIANGLYCAEPEGTPPNFCGTKEISVALADGFADNPWRQMTTAAAINEASRCPNVTSFEHTDGQGNTQKAISDIQGLAAKGVNAIVVFPDAGPAMLPAIRDAYKQGSAVVPYRVKVGGTEGEDYSVFVGTNFYDHGKLWAEWIAKAMNGKGTVGYEGGPPGNSESVEKSQGMHDVLKDYPDIQWIGQDPFEATNWDPSLMAKSITALISKYPKIDGMFGDLSIPILTSGAFQRAGKDMPLVAGEDANGFGCYWEKEHANGADSSFQFMTTSAEQWNVRLAVEWAIAEATGGKVDQPLVIKDTKGGEHVAANPGDKIVTNFVMDDSLKGVVFCTPELPDSAGNGTSLTIEQTLGALKGGL